MIRKHKKTLILSSLVTLLPIPVGLILWQQFPERITTHWGFDGQPDGWSSIPFAVIVMPLIMLAAQWLCVLATCYDKANRGRNKKPLTLVMWILPVVSNLTSFITYALALGLDFSVESLVIVPLGLMFAVIGNYMPKMKMNATMGIKVPWTYSSEANWNATHRFGGRMWLIGGLIVAASGLLPGEIGIWTMLIVMTVMTVLPIVYSWRFYKKEKAEGKAVVALVPNMDTKAGKISLVFLVLLLAFVAVLMFAGEIDITLGERSFTIDPTFYSGLTVDYDVIESIEYRDGPVNGARTSGFGSARLLLGFFHNQEFGTYTRYTYTDSDGCIVIHTDSRTLVLAHKETEQTKALYEALLTKVN